MAANTIERVSEWRRHHVFRRWTKECFSAPRSYSSWSLAFLSWTVIQSFLLLLSLLPISLILPRCPEMCSTKWPVIGFYDWKSRHLGHWWLKTGWCLVKPHTGLIGAQASLALTISVRDTCQLKKMSALNARHQVWREEKKTKMWWDGMRTEVKASITSH